jgi:cytochrome c
MNRFALVAALSLLAAPAFAQTTEIVPPTGDAAAGEELFNRQCVACHVVENEAGEVLAGRNAKVGPNLFGVVGRTPGTYPEFEYGDAMVEYGATGVVWAEENFVAYVMDPTEFLRTVLDNNRARGKMAFQVRDAADAANIYAFLATYTVAPAE